MKASVNSPVLYETVWVGDALMTIEVSDAARAIIWERGGDLYVWATVHGCFRGRLWLLKADTSRPPDESLRFERAAAGGFDVFLDLKGWPVPERLVLEVHGRRKKIMAYWNDRAYVF